MKKKIIFILQSTNLGVLLVLFFSDDPVPPFYKLAILWNNDVYVLYCYSYETDIFYNMLRLR
jgi:hypothetical protein